LAEVVFVRLDPVKNVEWELLLEARQELRGRPRRGHLAKKKKKKKIK
jgi:hypothetical protein